MTFSRSLSGIANFGIFSGADILVYTEGKDNSGASGIIFDEIYYTTLIRSIYPNKNVKVKCVGSKKDALDYASKLETSGAVGSVVIVDKDGDDLVSSLLAKRVLVYTEGYSWENDFWTQQIAEEVLQDLSCNNQANAKLRLQLQLMKRRLAFVSCLDICSRVNNGGALFQKNGGGCGIGFKYASQYVIPSKEVNRLINKYRQSGAASCSVCKFILTKSTKSKQENSIQGHLWEHAVLNLINHSLPGAKSAKIPNFALKNLAMSKFKVNPMAYLNVSTYDYYRNEMLLRFN